MHLRVATRVMICAAVATTFAGPILWSALRPAVCARYRDDHGAVALGKLVESGRDGPGDSIAPETCRSLGHVGGSFFARCEAVAGDVLIELEMGRCRRHISLLEDDEPDPRFL